MGSSRPEYGLEFEHAGLAAALEAKIAQQQKLVFDLIELKGFNLRPLRADSFIKVGAEDLGTCLYFRPVAPFNLDGMNVSMLQNSASCGSVARRQPRHQERTSPRVGNGCSVSSAPKLERHAPEDASSVAALRVPIGTITSDSLPAPRRVDSEMTAKRVLPLLDQFIDRLVSNADNPMVW